MTPSQAIPDEAKAWTMRDTGNHYNGGREWFGYLQRCVQQPRLSRFDKYLRKTRSVESTWRVDGADCASLSEAVERLRAAPGISEEELHALKFTLLDTIQRGTDLREEVGFEVMHSLGEKGLVEWGPPGFVKRSAAGILALQQQKGGA